MTPQKYLDSRKRSSLFHLAVVTFYLVLITFSVIEQMSVYFVYYFKIKNLAGLLRNTDKILTVYVQIV